MEALIIVLIVLLAITVWIGFSLANSVLIWKQIYDLNQITIENQQQTIATMSDNARKYRELIEYKDKELNEYKKMMAEGITGLVLNKDYKAN
ncbi:MAG TPA: hypothetical protein VNX68_09510 [Nitrosopumilaceae archaeon]|jgi:hypothetical protein|nr:hypothetical protein [Nitrosopumilaceae archaeon]